MKQLVIRQKFFTIYDKFAIKDENDNIMFYAKNEIVRLWANLALYDQSGLKILYTLRAKFFVLFSKVRILLGPYDAENDIGMIQERFAFPFCRARVKSDMPNIYVKCGPIHLKAYVVGDDWKKAKDAQPVISITKRLLKIADTYVINYDETKIPPALAALVGLWYDMQNHSEEH